MEGWAGDDPNPSYFICLACQQMNHWTWNCSDEDRIRSIRRYPGDIILIFRMILLGLSMVIDISKAKMYMGDLSILTLYRFWIDFPIMLLFCPDKFVKIPFIVLFKRIWSKNSRGKIYLGLTNCYRGYVSKLTTYFSISSQSRCFLFGLFISAFPEFLIH